MMTPTEWPKGLRVTLYWGGSLIAISILIYAAIAVAFMLGFGECESPGAAEFFVCSPIGRILLAGALIGGILVPYFPWVRYLKRALNIDDQGTA